MTITENSNLKIYVFTADWCSHCHLIKRELANFDYNINFLDIDEHEALADEFNVFSLPTVILTNENRDILYWGNENTTKDILKQEIKKHIAE